MTTRRPEWTHPIGWDARANEKARCWQGLKMAAGRPASNRWVGLVAGQAPLRLGLRREGSGKAGAGSGGAIVGGFTGFEPNRPAAGRQRPWPAGASAGPASGLFGRGVAASAPACRWARGSPSHPGQSAGVAEAFDQGNFTICLQLPCPGKELQFMGMSAG